MIKLSFKNSSTLAAELIKAASVSKADILGRFFKTGPGQYGEGDKFLGINVPVTRALARRYYVAKDELVEELLANPYHEVRLLGVLIIVHRYEQAKTDKDREEVVKYYLLHRQALNNWDLVDLSVYKVWGDYLWRHPEKRKLLYRFAQSKQLWERRMAVVATIALIKKGEFKEILDLSLLLLKDKEDLMHKAVGWMLREMGKKDVKVLCAFLDEQAPLLPRTALRYAIERLPEKKRLEYLKIKLIK